ncbi:hypothetical protein GYMLUDRAFT_242721 [Collybiopsis luxurians FD-317 M1]|uniref:tripeptidyl-peptidase II n=1 Tax=Collybiopsis luxurians FD-317 M1 TaxID=944289 RepID=A0A0D0CIR7_9AGAR|nr:hypothetical protein GYMLUDRAFT_242721 [Collybiopsis luxurians FD-317 M1]
MLSVAVVSLVFALQAVASPLSSPSALYDNFVTKHSWGTSLPPSSPWVYHSTPDPSYLLALRLSLRPSNYDALLDNLMQTSNPSHSRYGQHLSKDQVDELMQPTVETVNAVKSWLRWHNISDGAIKSSGNTFTLTIPLSSAEVLLNTTYHRPYSLPRHLHDHIDLVSPTTYFSNPRSLARENGHRRGLRASRLVPRTTVPSSCKDEITPNCLHLLYNTGNYTPTQSSRNVIGITGYLEEYASQDDLATFRKMYATDKSAANMTTVEVNSGKDEQFDPGTEANLDVQYVYGMTYSPMIFYSVGGRPPFNPDDATPDNDNEPYLNWLDYVGNLSDTELPKTISNSYGDDEQTVPPDYATNVCKLFSALGARGVSVIFASGDFGVGNGDCAMNDDSNKVVFQPVFPASCPFVTAVGGTTGIFPEVATQSFSSGGGFSRLFAQPSYQSNAVSSYLSSLGNIYSGIFNASGRAYPDVAAQGQNYQVVQFGFVEPVDGTSCATPTFAGVVALLNDYRLASGKTTLGFLNPLFYRNPLVFNDITEGSNPGCDTEGFSATKGWDPVTGLGTPNFVKLQTIM